MAEKEIHTAGKPDHIELVTDRNEIKADGKDLSFVTVRVVDKEGNLCPDAQHLIKYSVKGAGNLSCRCKRRSHFIGTFPCSADESV